MEQTGTEFNKILQDILARQKTMPLQHSAQARETYKCPVCRDMGFILRIGADGREYAPECECRKQRIMESRLRFANIPKEFSGYTVNSFDLSLYQSPDSVEKAKMAKLLCVNYVRNFTAMQDAGKGLYFYSRTKGSGKTRMAVSIANDIIAQYKVSAKFATTLQILDEIKKTWHEPGNEVSEHKFLQEIIHVPVLVIDDIGVEKPTDWAKEKFYSILNGRMIQKQVTIFTSNCEMEKLMFDDRITNRIMKMASPAPFPEESVRALLARAENKKLYKSFLNG